MPATNLKEACYYGMFYECTSLEYGPELPAKSLATNCYARMFYGCKKLNSITALFTTTPSSDYTNLWLSGVSSTGTFCKNKDATWDVRGVNGVPTN